MTTLDPAAVTLKLCFLVVLYLFLLWVVRSAARDLRRTRDLAEGGVAVPVDPAVDATGLHRADEGLLGDGQLHGEPRLVVEQAAGHPAGIAYALTRGATLGRGDVEIHIEDGFASSRHARLLPQGGVVVLEDLGSTNGTYLNDEPLGGPAPLHHGDRIRIGDSEFSYLHD
jgi:hypothetical protein